MLLSFLKQVIQKRTVLADQKPWPQHLRAEVVKPEITPVWGPAAQTSGCRPWGKIGTVSPSCSSIVRYMTIRIALSGDGSNLNDVE